MSALPEAVQRMADEAAAIEEQLRAAQADAGNVNDPAPTPPAADVNAPAEPPAAPQPTQDEIWQQRYQTLQAKYNAEVPRFAEQLRQANARMQDLEQKLAEKQAEPPKPVVSDEDKQAFGEDLLDTVDRIAKARTAEMAAQLAERDRQIAELQTKVGQVAGTVDEDAFFTNLDRAMPEWQQINVTQDFVNRWLQEVDPLTGVSRMTILRSHVAARDVERTLNVFRTYKASVTPAQPPSNPLAAQVAPSRDSSAGAPPVSADKKVWTQRDIARFYEDARRGNITPDEAARTEAEIMTAVAEGRVAA